MKLASALRLTALSLGLFAAMGTAHSAACTTGNITGLDTSDVTYGVDGPLTGPLSPADACFGLKGGNDSNTSLNVATVLAGWGNGFLQGARDNIGGTDVSNSLSLFGGTFKFSLTSTAGSSGNYTLSASDETTGAPDFPIFLDFVAVLKGSSGYAGWLFDDVSFDGSGGGAWEINFLNKGGNIPDLSHFSVYVRQGSSSSSSTSGQASTSSGNIPEPSSSVLALLGLSLVGGSFLMRRKAGQA